jgi:hypothetical protein
VSKYAITDVSLVAGSIRSSQLQQPSDEDAEQLSPFWRILFACQYLPGIQIVESITLELPIKRLTNAMNVTWLLYYV